MTGRRQIVEQMLTELREICERMDERRFREFCARIGREEPELTTEIFNLYAGNVKGRA